MSDEMIRAMLGELIACASADGASEGARSAETDAALADVMQLIEVERQGAWRAGLDEGRRQKESELAEAEDGRLQALEALVRGVGHDEAGVVDSMARSDVAEAMMALADAGRMQIQGGFGRRVFATWVTP